MPKQFNVIDAFNCYKQIWHVATFNLIHPTNNRFTAFLRWLLYRSATLERDLAIDSVSVCPCWAVCFHLVRLLFMKLDEMTETDKRMNQLHFGNYQADTRIQINPENRIRIPCRSILTEAAKVQRVRSVDVGGGICPVWVQSGLLTLTPAVTVSADDSRRIMYKQLRTSLSVASF